jgi:pimeloyl-ACP methyl ester carboxylesterase
MAGDGVVTAHDGVRIAYRDHGGSGRGLVLLHGGGANLESMDQYAARLGPGRRTVAIDIRCCGQSGDPAHFRLIDAATDVATVVDALGLGPVDVVGHSMGGFVAGFYAIQHPTGRVVSIDGFGPGMVTVGTDVERDEFDAFQAEMRTSFLTMTAPPDRGPREWRDSQIEMLCEIYPQIGYTAPNARRMAEWNFVDLGDGTFLRHPSRHLFENAFADDGDADILRMYRHVTSPTMIIRCTRSGAPPVLDQELAELASTNANVRVLDLPFTHLEPAWDAIEQVAHEADRFLRQDI